MISIKFYKIVIILRQQQLMQSKAIGWALIIFIGAILSRGEVVGVEEQQPEQAQVSLSPLQTPIASLPYTPTNNIDYQPQIVSVSSSEAIKIKIQRSPIYAYPGIIFDFIITPEIKRTQQQLENMFVYQFSSRNYQPKRVFVSVGQSSDSHVRVLFDYENNLPFYPFVCTFIVRDLLRWQLKEDRVSIVVDTLAGRVTSALFPDQSQDRIR